MPFRDCAHSYARDKRALTIPHCAVLGSPINFDPRLTLREASFITGWSTGYLRQRIAQGKLWGHKAGGLIWMVELQCLGPQFEWPNYRKQLPRRGKPIPLIDLEEVDRARLRREGRSS